MSRSTDEIQPSRTGRPAGLNLLVELAAQDHVLEHAEFDLALLHLARRGHRPSRSAPGSARPGPACRLRDHPAPAGCRNRIHGSSILAICVRRRPRASRRITWAFIWPTRLASASTCSCRTRRVSAICACWAASLLRPLGRLRGGLASRARQAEFVAGRGGRSAEDGDAPPLRRLSALPGAQN